MKYCTSVILHESVPLPPPPPAHTESTHEDYTVQTSDATSCVAGERQFEIDPDGLRCESFLAGDLSLCLSSTLSCVPLPLHPSQITRSVSSVCRAASPLFLHSPVVSPPLRLGSPLPPPLPALTTQ